MNKQLKGYITCDITQFVFVMNKLQQFATGAVGGVHLTLGNPVPKPTSPNTLIVEFTYDALNSIAIKEIRRALETEYKGSVEFLDDEED